MLPAPQIHQHVARLHQLRVQTHTVARKRASTAMRIGDLTFSTIFRQGKPARPYVPNPHHALLTHMGDQTKALTENARCARVRKFQIIHLTTLTSRIQRMLAPLGTYVSMENVRPRALSLMSVLARLARSCRMQVPSLATTALFVARRSCHTAY